MRQQEFRASTLDQINSYRNSNREIKGHILNVATLDRVEAANMVIFSKQMLLSTQKLQLNNYVVANRKILDALRENYPLEDE